MSRSIQLLIITLFTGLFLAACGGGGDGDTTTVADDGYTGLKTPVKITEENADELSSESLGASEPDLSAMEYIPGVETEIVGTSTSIPTNIKFAQVITDQVKKLNFGGSTFLPGVTQSETTDCYVSGTIETTFTANEETGDINGSIVFNDCVESDVTLSGSLSFTGKVDVDNQDSIAMTMTFSYLTVDYGSESHTMNGSIYIALSGIDMYSVIGLKSNIVMNYVVLNNTTGDTFKLEDYRVDAEYFETEVQMSISGKFYLPDYGYGVVTTIEPFLTKHTDFWPYDGQYRIDGDSSSLRVTCIDSTQYFLEVDEDGDGVYEVTATNNW